MIEGYFCSSTTKQWRVTVDLADSCHLFRSLYVVRSRFLWNSSCWPGGVVKVCTLAPAIRCGCNFRWIHGGWGRHRLSGPWEWTGIGILDWGLYGHSALSCPCAGDHVGAIATRVLFHRKSGASLSLTAPPLRLTEVVAYHTHEAFPPGGRGKPGTIRRSCEWILL